MIDLFRTTGRWSVAMLALMSLACLMDSPRAHADTMLLATTDLVSGSSAATFSFNAPSSGMVTAEITSVPWPVPLSELSFAATTASNTLASWSGDAPTTPQTESFQVGAGTYYAHVTAQATGSLDVGLYSLLVSFTPSASVPLPAAGGLLAIGILVMFGLLWTIRPTPNEEGSGLSRQVQA